MNISARLISEEYSALKEFMNVVATGLWPVHFGRPLFKLGDGPQGRG
jgi:hypothetical protein